MMWGDRPPRAKLTGDSRRGFEAVLIGDCRSVRSFARNWPLRLLRLLQQYGHKTEVPTGSEIVRFPRKTGSHQRTVRMTQLTHLVQLKQDFSQLLGRGITGGKTLSVNLAQRADEGVAVLVADFAVVGATAIV